MAPLLVFCKCLFGLQPAKPHENPATSDNAGLMTLTPLISARLDLQPRDFMGHAPAFSTRTLSQSPSLLRARSLRVIHILRVSRVARALDEGSIMKQNVTISLDRQTIRKAKIVAARRDTSISGLLARQLEILVGEEEAYERAERQAMELLDKGFHLGGGAPVRREGLHER